MKFLQFLTPMQLPTQKQWWSNPVTQWSQCLQCEALDGRMILQVLQWRIYKNLLSLTTLLLKSSTIEIDVSSSSIYISVIFSEFITFPLSFITISSSFNFGSSILPLKSTPGSIWNNYIIYVPLHVVLKNWCIGSEPAINIIIAKW